MVVPGLELRDEVWGAGVGQDWKRDGEGVHNFLYVFVRCGDCRC